MSFSLVVITIKLICMLSGEMLFRFFMLLCFNSEIWEYGLSFLVELFFCLFVLGCCFLIFVQVTFSLSVEVFTTFRIRLIHSSVGILIFSVCLVLRLSSNQVFSFSITVGNFHTLARRPRKSLCWHCGAVQGPSSRWENKKMPVKQLPRYLTVKYDDWKVLDGDQA